MGFVGEDALFGGAGSAALLSACFFDAGPFGSAFGGYLGGQFGDEHLASKEAILTLVAGGLALDLQTGGPVDKLHAGGGFVDVLSAVAAGANEGFHQVFFANAEFGHAAEKGVVKLVQAGFGAHGGKVIDRGRCRDREMRGRQGARGIAGGLLDSCFANRGERRHVGFIPDNKSTKGKQ